MAKNYKPVTLIVLDGWGIAPPGPGNAIRLAKTPFFDQLRVRFPRTRLKASGKEVGLPKGERGTSEVGHLNIGAGRIVWQDVSKINDAIVDGSFFKNSALVNACEHVKENQAQLHLMGLVGGGSVHSSLDHLYALLELAKKQNVPGDKVKIHVFTDGRDSPPQSAKKYIQELQQKMEELKIGKIVSVTGRYYAMDRDRNWQRTKVTYSTLVAGNHRSSETPEQAIENAYSQGDTDEFIKPTIIENKSDKESYNGKINEDDAVIFFNFRADRARQITKAFVLPEFKYFDRDIYLENLHFVSLVEYEKEIPVKDSAFIPHLIRPNLSQVISQQGGNQFHIAESEKYAYVTYYFNGGIEKAFPGEERKIVPSPDVPTYEQAPEMSIKEVSQIAEKKIRSQQYDFVLINFANPDMLGHTGIIPAAIEGIEATDKALKRVVEATFSAGGACVVTSDHGNVEEMINPATGEVSTSHSNNRVPLIIAAKQNHLQSRELQSGILADIAPTVLKLMGVPKPNAMAGHSLI